MGSHLALLSPVERQDRRFPRTAVIPRVHARPLVEMTKLLRNRASFLLVAFESPVEAAPNVAPHRTVGVAGIAPRTLCLHVAGGS